MTGVQTCALPILLLLLSFLVCFPVTIEEPLEDIEMFQVLIEKILSDKANWKNKAKTDINKLIMTIVIAIAILVGVYVLARMIMPSIFGGTPTPTEINMTENITQIIANNQIQAMGG